MLRKLRLNLLRRKAMESADKMYPQKIDMSQIPEGVMPLLNHKCHFNAVHAVKAGKAAAVIECVIVDDLDCTAHYINQMQDGSYCDYTLGWLWSGADYRFCRIVPEQEYKRIDQSLSDLKSLICSSHLRWYDRIMKIDKWDVC